MALVRCRIFNNIAGCTFIFEIYRHNGREPTVGKMPMPRPAALKDGRHEPLDDIHRVFSVT
jgi:hypothetical protein